MAIGLTRPSGRLNVNVIRAQRAPLRWQLSWKLRPRYIWAWLGVKIFAPLLSKLFPVTTVTSELKVRIKQLGPFERDRYLRLRMRLKESKASLDNMAVALDQFHDKYGTWIDYGVVSRRVVSDTGVAFLIDQWDGGAQDIANFIYHGVGSSSLAEAAGDIGLGTEFLTEITPDNTRATGTQSQPASNQIRTVATVTFDGAVTVEEHGVFDQAATGSGTLWDRSLTGGQALGAGDSFQGEYTCTFGSGG